MSITHNSKNKTLDMSRVIKASEVVQMIENGMKRPEIKESLGLTGKEMTALFKHPSLANRRAATTPAISFTFVDDIAGERVTDETEVSLTTLEEVENFINGEEMASETFNGFSNPVV